MNNHQKTISLRIIVQTVFFVFLLPFLPLLISRHWDWWEAWLYAAVCILGFIISRVLVNRRHSDLLAERVCFTRHENAKPWDRLLAPLVGLGGGLIPVVAGLDKLFYWSPAYSLPIRIASLAIILGGFTLGSYALIENRFFSSVVRIQTDRGHRVVSSGPYRWIRHPGYAGGLLTYLSTPFFLDSQWALLPGVFLSVLLIIRTRLEDRTLQDELHGYRDYAKKVRFRLLPGAW
jgi:protein-S-isoprenylcysteine O-methyltransferase Ste14